jgi:hypothetical protein
MPHFMEFKDFNKCFIILWLIYLNGKFLLVQLVSFLSKCCWLVQLLGMVDFQGFTKRPDLMSSGNKIHVATLHKIVINTYLKVYLGCLSLTQISIDVNKNILCSCVTSFLPKLACNIRQFMSFQYFTYKNRLQAWCMKKTS